jgi:tetratricopeptide (TPR) repeat protein
MNFHYRRSVRVTLRVIIAAACCLGIWNSWRFAHADYLFRKVTERSVRAAIRLAPDAWEYYVRLAQLDQAHSRELLSTAVRLNRYNAGADIELGLQYEAEGDFTNAEKSLLAAFDVDQTYLPRWSLANFYFRRNNMSAFWSWARKAAEMPANNIDPLFELCGRASRDPATITSAILNDKPELIRQYLGFLLAKDQLPAVASIARQLIRFGNRDSDRPLLFAAVNRLVAANESTAAVDVWHSLIDQHWVARDDTVPNNADFARAPLPVSLDWSLPEYPGLHSWPGPSGLETELDGSQPEDCTIAEQAVPLTPGSYAMSYAYRTADIPPATGIRWQIIDAKSNAVLANSSDLSGDTLQHSSMVFSVPPDARLIKLRLAYRRAIGTTRISGMLVVLSTRIKALPAS